MSISKVMRLGMLALSFILLSAGFPAVSGSVNTSGTCKVTPDEIGVPDAGLNHEFPGSETPEAKAVAMEEDPEEPVNEDEYAIFYVYRPGKYAGLLTFNIYLDNELLCKASSNWAEKIRVYRNGKLNLCTKSEKMNCMLIDVEFGEEYFIRCTAVGGMIVARLEMEEVSREVAKAEIDDIETHIIY